MKQPILTLGELKHGDQTGVGGKAWALSRIAAAGMNIPPSLCVTTTAYQQDVKTTGLKERILLELSRKDFADMRWEEMKHWICSPDKAVSEWVVRGTPVDGEPFAYMGCDLWEFRDGYVTKKDTYWKYIG